MILDDFVFVTSNLGKLREAEAVLGCKLDHRALDLAEIQSLDLVEVVRDKAARAWQRLERPVLVEDGTWRSACKSLGCRAVDRRTPGRQDCQTVPRRLLRCLLLVSSYQEWCRVLQRLTISAY